MERDRIITLHRCRTDTSGAGYTIDWLDWLRPDEFTLAGMNPGDMRAYALETFLDPERDF